MIAAFSTFDRGATLSALLPAIFFGGLDKFIDLRIFGTVRLGGVIFAIALRTYFLFTFRALSVNLLAIFVYFDMLWFDPSATALGRAVKAVFGRPFCKLVVPGFTECTVENVSDFGRRDRFILAAFRRHVLDIFGTKFEGPFDA